jgi:RHS repeat-associated protein
LTELNGQVKDERLYLGLFELYRRHGAGALERESLHVRDGERPVALVETRTDVAAESLVRYRFDDRLGSAVLELDAAGKLVTYEEHTPFGSTSFQSTRNQTDARKRYRFTGRERDEESGLYHQGDRYYAPWLARWTSTDPLGVDESPNLYTYVSNRPTAQIDPDGRQGRSPVLEGLLHGGVSSSGGGGPQVSTRGGPSGGSTGSSGGGGGVGAALGSFFGTIGRGFAAIGRALGTVFNAIANGLRAVSGFIREWFPGVIAAPLAGLVDMLGGLSRTLAGIFSWRGQTVLRGLADIGKGFLSIFGLKEALTEGWHAPPTRTDAAGNVHGLPTGMPMPRSLANDLWDAQNATQADAAMNGMHSWHAASNAHLATRVGPIGSVFLWLAGLFHETFDIESFKAEQEWQGTTNHILDSLMDIVSNTFGIFLGMILPRHWARTAASWLGNYIPGPGEPDPAFGGGGFRYGEGPRANDPRRAWGHYPPLRGPGTTREQLPP